MAGRSLQILSPTAILGYGFSESSFMRGIAMKPDLIAVDAGSIDPGPYYLGAGVSFTDRAAVKRDLRYMISEAANISVPVIVGSCGGSGAMPHLEWTRDIVEEVLEEEKLTARVGLIYADLEKDDVIAAVERDETAPLHGLKGLDRKTVLESTHIVAQMGVEPIIDALEKGCDIILAGRAYDPAVFAALPISEGFAPGLAIHLGMILECAAIAAEPGSMADCVLGILHEDSFELVPLADECKFTREGVAAHSLRGKADPLWLPGPGGHLDLSNVSFEEEGGRVRVRGSLFVPSEDYLIKLEAARRVGYRTISIAGVRDPTMIEGIDEILYAVEERAIQSAYEEQIDGKLHFHVYGRNGVMGELEPVIVPKTHEMCVVIEAIAPAQDEANALCSLARLTLLHYGYRECVATTGNLAFPFSPCDTPAGPIYEYSIYHVMKVEDQSIFRLRVVEL